MRWKHGKRGVAGSPRYGSWTCSDYPRHLCRLTRTPTVPRVNYRGPGVSDWVNNPPRTPVAEPGRLAHPARPRRPEGEDSRRSVVWVRLLEQLVINVWTVDLPPIRLVL